MDKAKSRTTVKFSIYKGDTITKDGDTQYVRNVKMKEEIITLDGVFTYEQIVKVLNQKLSDYGMVVKIEPIKIQKVVTVA